MRRDGLEVGNEGEVVRGVGEGGNPRGPDLRPSWELEHVHHPQPVLRVEDVIDCVAHLALLTNLKQKARSSM